DEALASGGRVKALVADGMAGSTRRETDELVELARRFGARGLVHVAVLEGEIRSPIAKFLGDETLDRIVGETGASPGDLILIVADTADVTNGVLGRLRVELAGRLGLA